MAAKVTLTVISAIVAWLALSHVTPVDAQTFDEYPVSSDWPGISMTCATALNTTVQCSGLLPVSAENNQPRLNAENLTSLCTASCLTSLINAKQTIQAACTLATDVITLDEGTFPATYLVDLFKYTYGINCRVDSTTQQYCDVLLGQWLSQPSLTAAQNCSDCMLGVSQMQLNSPFGYDDAFASDFTSLTSSCSKTTYPFTSPAPYTAAISTTVTPSPSASPVLDPGCVKLYTIQAGDTCESIAVSQNVSTWAVYGASGIRDCSNLPTGSGLCLQGQCWRYQVQENDTCDSIIAAAHISVSPITFVAWNPNINPTRTMPATKTNSLSSRPTGVVNPNITVPDATALATVTGWPTIVPTVTPRLPSAPGTQTGCTNYVNYRDTAVYDSLYQPESPLNTYIANLCSYVAASNNITIDYLLAWNPSLGTSQVNCSLATGYSYCVAFGNNTGIPSSAGTGCLSVNSTAIVPGTSASCNCYTQYSGYDAGYITCSTITDSLIFKDSNNLTLADLQAWNPWLGSDCDAGLFANLTGDAERALCVGTGNATSTSSQSVSSSTSFTSSRSTSSTSSPSTSSSSPPTSSSQSTRLSASSTSSSSSSTSSSPPASVCISGTYTTNPNQQGLCQFSCSYGYCPPGPCICSSYGAQVSLPPATGVAGYPLAGEDASYIGLCSFTYNYGYYPTTACTSHADGTPQ